MLTYSTGEWNAVVTPLAVAVFAPEMPVETLGDVWRGLGAEPGPGAVIGGLVGSFGSSLGVLPSFAAAFYDVAAGEVRLMVRGTARARVLDTSGVELEVAGLGVATWTERAVAGPARVELFGAGSDGIDLPLRDGVVAAGSVRWVLAAVDAARGATEPASVSASIEEHTPPAAPLPVMPPSAVVPPEETPVAIEPSPAPAAEAETSIPPLVDDTMAPLPDHTHAEIDATTGYDDLLFGETRLGTVEEAAVRDGGEPIEIVDPLAAVEDGSAGAPAHESAAPVITPAAAEAPEPPTRVTLITGIPGGSAPSAPTPAPTVTRPGDHDGETVSAEQVAALAAQAAASAAPSFTPAQTVAVAPTLVVSTGERVLLDRSAVIGRRPRAVRATGAIPHLVAVASPNQDISRNHVELRVEGTDVVATDLGTTNGTWLLRAGSDPVRLQPSEAVLIVPGDQLDLGEGVVLSFEGLR